MATPSLCAVTAESDQAGGQPLLARAESLAAQLCLPFITAPADGGQYALLLVVTQERLELREVGRGSAAKGRTARPGAAVWTDFVAGRLGRRAATPGFGASMLRRAVDFRAALGVPWRVCDATAGLARDAFLLAAIGCEVTAVERSPIVAAVVQDGLDRAKRQADSGHVAAAVDRLRLIVADSRDWLAGLAQSDRPDVVYLDPMFPERTKSALVKKEMRICRLVAGEDPDAGELLDIAVAVARNRVVVKRPRAAPPLTGRPAFSLPGQTIRYDVYLPLRAAGRD